MSSLSVLTDGVFVKCADPIFPTSDIPSYEGAEFTFEVFNDDAASLRARLGVIEQYALISQPPFWGKLTSLEPCVSTHSGLLLLRDKPTLKGILLIVPHATQLKQ